MLASNPGRINYSMRPGFEASVMEAMLELAECVLNLLHAALTRVANLLWLTALYNAAGN